MTPRNLNKYVNYFRTLAITHPQIGHDPASETGNPDAGPKRFAKWTPDEVIGGLRTTVQFPALLIQLYETNLNAEVEYDVRQNPMGAFTVLQQAQSNNLPQEEEAYALTEQIVYQLLQKIWEDHYEPGVHRCQSPFKNFFFNNISITPTGRLFNSTYGWHVEFAFQFHDALALNQPPEPGLFNSYLILGNGDEWLGSDGAYLGEKL